MSKSIFTVEERFWMKVDKRSDDECWDWTGGVNSDGYGSFRISTFKIVGSHRAAWMFSNGEIPNGLGVLHECDRPPCCNPKHLFLGTQLDNIADRTAKGRSNRGETQPLAKMTEEKVLELRKLFGIGYSQAELSRMFQIDDVTVNQIVHRRTWKHI